MSGQTISAIMVSYRTGPVLLKSVEALLADPGIAELVLVDHDNPPDLRDRLDQVSKADPRLRVIRTNRNLGFGKGCNLGAAAATLDWLVFVNPDAIVETGAAGKLIAALGNRPEPAIAGARILNEDGTEQRGARRRELTLWRAIATFSGLSRWFSDASLGLEGDPLPECPVDVPTVSGAAFAISAAGFRDLGGFDEGYFLHVEDIDICRRAETVVFVPDAVIHHAGGTSRASRLFVEFEKAKSFLRYFWKYNRSLAGRIATVLVAPFLVSAILLRAIFLGVAGFFSR